MFVKIAGEGCKIAFLSLGIKDEIAKLEKQLKEIEGDNG